MTMQLTRCDAVLAALAPASGGRFTPVQVQKLLFVLDMEAASELGGPHFRFQPYHYGPFDHEVYELLETLSLEGLVSITDEGQRLRQYELTPEGQARADEITKSLEAGTRDYIDKLVAFVRGTTFAQLVSAIYRRYPDMRVNSVFQD